MTSSTTDADRILGTGVPIKLADGSTVTLRYGMLGVRDVDAHFGSVSAMFTALNGTLTTPIAEPLAHAIAAGLRHRNAEARHTADALLEQDLIDTAQTEPYIEAVVEAMMQAFPPLRRAVEELSQQDQAAAPATTDSPGTSGTTPPPSGSDGQTATSPT